MNDPGLLAEIADGSIAGNLRLDEGFLHAMNGRNIEGVMACFLNTLDLVVVLDGSVLQGPEALRRCLAELFAEVRTLHLDIIEISRWSIGETVFAVGIAKCQLEALDGSKRRLKVCWTDARRQVAGRWVYVLDHATNISGRRPPTTNESWIGTRVES